MSYTPKRVIATTPLRVGVACNLHSFILPPNTSDELTGVSLKSVELVALNSDWYPAVIPSAYRNFARSKTIADRFSLVGGYRIPVEDGEAMIHLSFQLDLASGELTSQGQLKTATGKRFKSIEEQDPFSHALFLLELKMANTHS